MKYSKIKGLLAIAVIYFAAFVFGFFMYQLFPFNSPLLKLFLANILVCLFIFVFSLIFKNASIFEPYWGLAPVIMAICFVVEVKNYSPYAIIVLALIIVWGIRLTIHWGIHFVNLNVQDFRYTYFQNKYPKLYPVINLLGFHLFPALIVFIGLMPILFYLYNISTSTDYSPTVMTILALTVGVIGVFIETLADLQLYLFTKVPANDGLVFDRGLWKNSRHPNYFGECLFWFSLFLIAFSMPKSNPIFVFSPLAIFLLFEFISIPLIDKHEEESKPAYKEYKSKTNAMLPFFPLKNEKK